MSNSTMPDSRKPGEGRKTVSTWHFWAGMDFFGWMRLLARNRFAIAPRFWIPVAIISVFSVLQTLARWLQQALFGRRIGRAEMPHAPLFILGHWRTGTTFLHDLLALDANHAFPSTFVCGAPNHFLLSEPILARLFPNPRRGLRGFDNVVVGPDRPQEDEFALCLLGLPSPYLTAAFPNNGMAHPEYLDLEGLSPRALGRWKRVFSNFLRQLNFRYGGRRIVLKSPPHTARVRVLRELFPDSRFVFLMRNPYEVFPSTLHMQRHIYRMFALQRPTFAGQEEFVFRDFLRLHRRLEEQRAQIPPRRFHEIRYEDLVRDPVGEMARLYEELELGGFAEVRPKLEEYVATLKGYQTNKFTMDAATCDEITRRWGEVITRYGYTASGVNAPIPAATATV